MKKLPIILIYSRLIIGVIILCLSFSKFDTLKYISISLVSIGLLTDVFDGIIARKLNVSTEKLRRLDSTIDLIFFMLVIVSTYIQCPDFYKSNFLKLILLIGFEGLTYVVCFIKFKKEVATHTIGAKIWTLFLFTSLIQIILECQSTTIFNICFYFGIITRIEIILIILIVKKWVNDVPTIFHAIKLRQGREIKRNKIFNG